MKKLLFFGMLWLAMFSARAQNGIPFKILLAQDNNLLRNQNVILRIGLRDVNFSPIYTETHQVTTDTSGIARVILGNGSVVSGDFSTIDWAQNYLIKTEVSLDNGSTYLDFGTTRMYYVPYALGAFSGGDTHELNDLEDVRVANYSIFIGEGSGVMSRPLLFNLAIGVEAMALDTSGTYNSTAGYRALYANASGISNTGIGYMALYHNIASNNTGAGYQTMYSNRLGLYNIAMGSEALFSDTMGNNNIAMGYRADYADSSGTNNIAIGYAALYYKNNGEALIAIGDSALYSSSSTSSQYDVAIGSRALMYQRYNRNSTALGNSALYHSRDYPQTAVGFHAGYNSLFGPMSTIFGSESAFNQYRGRGNTIVGFQALYLLTYSSNSFHTAAGYKALYHVKAQYNTGVGYKALYSDSTGSNSTALGTRAFVHGNYTNSMGLGFNAEVTADNQIRLGNTQITGIGGYANWSTLSDGRFKKDVKENVPGMALIMRLRPVTYRLNMNALNKRFPAPESFRLPGAEAAKAAEWQTGFIAQEVEQAAGELGFDFHAVDKPKNPHDLYGLRYAEFVPVLVKGIQELQNDLQEHDRQLRRMDERLQHLEQQQTQNQKP